jgi:uncharacterized protein YcfJ
MTDSKFFKNVKATTAGVILAASSNAMANEAPPPISPELLKERVEQIAKMATAEVNKVDCEDFRSHEINIALEKRIGGTAIATGIGAFAGGYIGAGVGAVAGTAYSLYTWGDRAKEIETEVAHCETNKQERLQKIEIGKSLSVMKP